jgi:Sugar-transfer associated ATP-grasp
MPGRRSSNPVAIAKRVRQDIRVVARLIRLEREDYAGALHPSMWRRGFFSNRVYTYPGIADPSAVFISDVRYHFRGTDLNEPTARFLLLHKNVFADLLTARGLGSHAPEVYGAVTVEGLRVRSADARDRLWKQDTVVVKPATGQGGVGVRLASPAEVEAMAIESGPDLLVQERVRQHPEIAKIHPGSLNTVRVLAVRLPGHGPVLAAAVHRWGTVGTGPVDNISAGGLCSRVDLATGVLGPAVGMARERRRVEFDRHPDTGAPITGTVVPEWAGVRDLALRLMDAFPELSHVGWDLAVSDRGVQIIEGNASMPAVSVFQFHGPFLEDPRLVEYYRTRGLLRRT